MENHMFTFKNKLENLKSNLKPWYDEMKKFKRKNPFSKKKNYQGN